MSAVHSLFAFLPDCCHNLCSKLIGTDIAELGHASQSMFLGGLECSHANEVLQTL